LILIRKHVPKRKSKKVAEYVLASITWLTPEDKWFCQSNCWRYPMTSRAGFRTRMECSPRSWLRSSKAFGKRFESGPSSFTTLGGICKEEDFVLDELCLTLHV